MVIVVDAATAVAPIHIAVDDDEYTQTARVNPLDGYTSDGSIQIKMSKGKIKVARIAERRHEVHMDFRIGNRDKLLLL